MTVVLSQTRKFFSVLTLCMCLSGAAVASSSIEIEIGESTKSAPPDISALYALEADETGAPIEEGVGLDIRIDALKEAALSYGARGGLAFRTYEIRQELEGRSRYLDKVFDFRQLLIRAPSGLLIEPPVISEAENNLVIEGKGLEAAVSDRFYNINKNARIVTAPKNWRQFLEREWGEVEPPPNILRPKNKEERKLWKEQIAIGWDEGYSQGEEIFEMDLNQLMAQYRGMIRYRILLAEGMITPTLAVQTDRGVTGGGDQMRVGDRAVQIVDLPKLIPESSEWQPANR